VSRPRHQQVATGALGVLLSAKQLRPDDALPLIGPERPTLRARALHALAGMPSPEVAAAVSPLALAGDRDALRVLLVAVRAGVATPAQRATALDAFLARAAEGLDATICHGLGAFAHEDPRARDALFLAARDPDPFVRHDVAGVLGEVGSDDAAAILAALATDETIPSAERVGRAWSVGEQARRALAKIRARRDALT